MRAVVRAITTVTPHLASTPASGSQQRRRTLVADLCKLLGGQYVSAPKASLRSIAIERARPAGGGRLTPRLRQTLERMLLGDSEKQIASHLKLSRHTVHIYVKALYKAFDVNSRGELLAKFVGK